MMDDKTIDLVNRARAADKIAIDELFSRYREPLRRGLRKMLGDSYRWQVADSEDATHDAILSALAQIEHFEYRGEGSFLAWLLKRAEREVLNKIRARRAARRTPKDGGLLRMSEAGDPTADDQSVAGQANLAELGERVRACLDELPEKERDVILLRRFMELDASEICTELGLTSPAAARNLLARAQARLAGIMSRRGVRPEDLA